MAWSEAEMEYAELNARKVIGEWEALSDSEKVDFLGRCVNAAKKRGEFCRFGSHDLDEFISEAYIRVIKSLDVETLKTTNERRAAKSKKPVTLVKIVYNAAKASLEAIRYADSKHGVASDWDVDDGDGENVSYLESFCEDARQDTAKKVALRLALLEYADTLDDIGRVILRMLVEDGSTEREIGAACGISGVAVHKRIVKMRPALAEIIRAA